VPTADSTLINGQGRFANGPTSALTVIQVEATKRYRFRLVSISCDLNYQFSIDGHTMVWSISPLTQVLMLKACFQTIIEVDSINVEPYTVDQIQIFAGQRYSFVLTASQPVDNYWIRAEPNIGSVGFDGGLNSAILRYSGAAEVDPTTSSTVSNAMLETSLRPLTNPGAPGVAEVGAADVNINLDIQFTGQFTVNSVTFTPPSTPALLQIMSGARTAQDLLPNGSFYVLPPNSVVEVSIPGGSIGSPVSIFLGLCSRILNIFFQASLPSPWCMSLSLCYLYCV